jgi:hypothetical protein
VNSLGRSTSHRLGRPGIDHSPERRERCALSSALAAFGKVIRSAIEDSDRAGDQDTNDIFIEISRGVDKWLWMVEAHLSPDE